MNALSGGRTPVTRRGVHGRATRVLLLLSAVLLAGSAAAPVQAVAGWTTPQRVWNGKFYELSTALDRNGKLHAVMAGFSPNVGLTYVTNAGGTWAARRLTRSLDRYPSLAVDPQGRISVAFTRQEEACDPGCGLGTYLVSNRTGSWSTKRISSRPDDWAPSLRIHAGKHHIVWARGGVGIAYATDAGGTWRTRLAIADEEVSTIYLLTRPMLRIDDVGRLHVAYQGWELGGLDADSTGIRYANNVGGPWSVTHVTTGPADDSDPWLVLDGAARAHIAFSREGAGNYYATNKTGRWGTVRISAAGTYGPPSLTVDANAKAYAALDIQTGIAFSTNRLGAWTNTIVAAGYEPEIKLGSNGKAHILYLWNTGGRRGDGLYYTRQT